MEKKLAEIVKQYELLLDLSQGIVNQADFQGEEVKAFVDAREKIIKSMKDRQLILSLVQKQQLQALTAEKSLNPAEKLLADLYTKAKNLNKKVVDLDQIISLRMRKSSQEASEKLKVMNTSKKINGYGQAFQNSIIDTGERYNRLR